MRRGAALLGRVLAFIAAALACAGGDIVGGAGSCEDEPSSLVQVAVVTVPACNLSCDHGPAHPTEERPRGPASALGALFPRPPSHRKLAAILVPVLCGGVFCVAVAALWALRSRTATPKERHGDAGPVEGGEPSGSALSLPLLLRRCYGYRFFWLMTASSLGGTSAFFFGSLAVPYIYKAYRIPASRVALNATVLRFPGCMMAVVGVVLDNFPLCGYTKAPHFLWVTGLGILGAVVIGVDTGAHMPFAIVMVCLFCILLALTVSDVLVNMRRAEVVPDQVSVGPALLAWMMGLGQVGELSSNIVVGPALLVKPSFPFLLMTIPLALMTVPAILGYFEERRVSREEARAKRARALWEEPSLSAVVLLVFLSSMCLTVCSVATQSPWSAAIISTALLLAVIGCVSATLSPVIARCCAYSVLLGSLTLTEGQAGFLFLTDTAEQFPDGPHLTPVFFNTALMAFGIIPSLIGVWFYYRFMASLKYWKIACSAVAVITLHILWGAFGYSGLSHRLGIPYRVWIFGKSFAVNVCEAWQIISLKHLFALLCPKGREATMYCMMCGCLNLGGLVGLSYEGLALHLLRVDPAGRAGEAAQFDNLWICSTVTAAIGLVKIPLAYMLLPDAGQGEPLDAVVDPTAGSWMKRWTRRDGPVDDAHEAS